MIGGTNLSVFLINKNYTTLVTNWTSVKAGTSISSNQISFTGTNSGAISADSFDFGKTGKIQLAFTTSAIVSNSNKGGQLRVGLIPDNGTVNNLRGFSFIDSAKTNEDIRIMHDVTVVYTVAGNATNGYTYAVELSKSNSAAYMQNNTAIYTGNIDIYTPMRIILDNTLVSDYAWTISDIVIRGF